MSKPRSLENSPRIRVGGHGERVFGKADQFELAEPELDSVGRERVGEASLNRLPQFLYVVEVCHGVGLREKSRF